MSDQNRFSEEQIAELQSTVSLLEFTRAHAERAEVLRVEELGLSDYQQSIIDDYRSQLHALSEALPRLVDLRLEQSDEADQMARGIEDGWEIAAALQSEMARIVDLAYQEKFGQPPDDAT